MSNNRGTWIPVDEWPNGKHAIVWVTVLENGSYSDPVDLPIDTVMTVASSRHGSAGMLVTEVKGFNPPPTPEDQS